MPKLKVGEVNELQRAASNAAGLCSGLCEDEHGGMNATGSCTMDDKYDRDWDKDELEVDPIHTDTV